MGYILGSSAKVAAGDWHWALRVRATAAAQHTNMHTKTLLQGLVVRPVMDLGLEGSVVADAPGGHTWMNRRSGP